MDQNKQRIQAQLDHDEKYRLNLFCRDYLLTDASLDCFHSYPFYGNWKQVLIPGFSAWVHPEEHVYCVSDAGRTALLIGHAYNPMRGEIREDSILRQILSSADSGKDALYSEIDDLTGVFVLALVNEAGLFAVQDCGGQKMLYFGKVGANTVLTSAPQLAADVFGLKRDREVLRLLSTKGYFRGSGFLPGNLSPYTELKRLGANTCLRLDQSGFAIERIYPRRARKEFRTEEEKTTAIEQMYAILSSNVSLALKKWPRVGLSLTGGMDSKTTFACAKAHYGDFFCYSFESKESEKLDADAAEQICRAVGIEHHRYLIPEDPAQIPDYDFQHQIIEHNTSHLCKLHPNEIRKYIWLRGQHDFDAEIKSDMSEVGRAYSSRKYYKVKLPRILAPRHMTITQARYFLEPWAMRYADRAYRSFMEETGLKEDLFGYSMHDLTYWEVRMSSWAATSLASQQYFHEITIPYNNRRLLDLFLQFPESERLQDGPHKLLMRRGNPAVADLDLSVKDSYLGKKRMLIETAYYYYATRGNTLGKK